MAVSAVKYELEQCLQDDTKQDDGAAAGDDSTSWVKVRAAVVVGSQREWRPASQILTFHSRFSLQQCRCTMAESHPPQ